MAGRSQNSLIAATAALLLVACGGAAPAPVAQSQPSRAAPPSGATCSPPGTATCDGQGRPIEGPAGGAASGGASVPVLDVAVRSIALTGGGTNGLDIDPSTGLVYAVNNASTSDWCGVPVGARSNTLSIVDADAGREIASVPTDPGPVWPLVDSTRDVVYVAASTEGRVAVHRLGSGQKVKSISVGGLPHDLGLEPRAGLLIVSNTNDGSQRYMSVVDPASGTVRAHHRVARFPHRIAFDAAEARAYMMSVESGTITVVDMRTGEVIDSFDSGGGGTMAFSSRARRLFVPGRNAGAPNTIRALDADTHAFIGEIGAFAGAGHQAFGLTVDERRGLLYATVGDSNLVGVADIQTLQPLGVFEVDTCPWGVRLDPARGRGYVTSPARGTVGVFDLEAVAAAARG